MKGYFEEVTNLLDNLTDDEFDELMIASGIENKMDNNCKHCLGEITENEIEEKGCYCELTGKWENITLGDCLNNCEAQEN